MLAILVLKKVWILQSSIDMGILFKTKPFFVNIEKKINKSPSQIMLKVI